MTMMSGVDGVSWSCEQAAATAEIADLNSRGTLSREINVNAINITTIRAIQQSRDDINVSVKRGSMVIVDIGC